MNLIYQFWSGPVPFGAKLSRESMSSYARTVGADYRFERGGFVKASTFATHSDSLRPIWDESFDAYDKILFLDADIYVRDGVKESIFNEPLNDIGICEEPHMPEYRDGRKHRICGDNDRKWAALVKDRLGVEAPTDDLGRPKVFNSGLILYSREGIEKARKSFIPLQEYIREIRRGGLPHFYTADQNYIHAMLFSGRVTPTVLSSEWNRQVHGWEDGSTYDERSENTRFVHVQLSSADNAFDKDTFWRIVNLPQSDWNLPT